MNRRSRVTDIVSPLVAGSLLTGIVAGLASTVAPSPGLSVAVALGICGPLIHGIAQDVDSNAFFDQPTAKLLAVVAGTATVGVIAGVVGVLLVARTGIEATWLLSAVGAVGAVGSGGAVFAIATQSIRTAA